MKLPFATVLATLSVSAANDDGATFGIPTHAEGWNPDRYIVQTDDDVEGIARRLARIQGANVSRVFGTVKKMSVVEFTDHEEAIKFEKEAAEQGIRVEKDPPVYPLGRQIRGSNYDVTRNLAETIPWGINKVFERDDGTTDIPQPNDLPNVIHKICIIDSGYQVSHPDLVDTASNADPGQSNTFRTDPCGHGSHVAGTILATDNEEGVIGVFPGASALIVKVFDTANCGWSYMSSLIAAAEHCVDAGANIISMSLGSSWPSSLTEEAFQEMNDDKNVLSIAAAGNDGNSGYSYPASYSSIMSVGATAYDDSIASFSQHNDQVDISGPGVSVKSTVGSGYSSYSGTSMATPHVSGVALLLWNNNPTCTNTEIRQALEAGSKDLGAPGRDNYYGHGLVNYWKAVDYLTANPCGSTLSPTVTNAPTSPSAPTRNPTRSPTQNPTRSPTRNPTRSPTPPKGPCKTWCATNPRPWSAKCNWKNCAGCQKCFSPCKAWCAENNKPWSVKCNWKNCAGCQKCVSAGSK